jgi:uncharacterized protein (DUF1778 family)
MAAKLEGQEGRVLVSVSVPVSALDQVRRAAKKARKPLSTFMREAAVEKAKAALVPSVAA